MYETSQDRCILLQNKDMSSNLKWNKEEQTNLSFNKQHIEWRKEFMSSLMQFYKPEFQSHFERYQTLQSTKRTKFYKLINIISS